MAPSQETMYRLLVEGIRDCALYMLDPNGTVLNWNTGAKLLSGYKSDEIIGLNHEVFYCAEDRDRHLPGRNLDRARRAGHLTIKGLRRRKDGTSFWASGSFVPIFDERGTHLGFAATTFDLTAEREALSLVSYEAIHDPLTGVLNRAGLSAEFENELPQIAYGSSMALHCIDLDRFKPVNDAFGHHAGDAVLCEVARRLEAVANATGRVGRLGGDEFAVLQFGSPKEADVDALANRIVESLSRPFEIDGMTIHIGGSVGVACAPTHGFDTTTLFRNADLALYQAKKEGRNRARFFCTL